MSLLYLQFAQTLANLEHVISHSERTSKLPYCMAMTPYTMSQSSRCWMTLHMTKGHCRAESRLTDDSTAVLSTHQRFGEAVVRASSSYPWHLLLLYSWSALAYVSKYFLCINDLDLASNVPLRRDACLRDPFKLVRSYPLSLPQAMLPITGNSP